VAEDTRFAIGDLADLGGVSRRTVRYYVQEGLLPAPLGVGRGNHYGREHLEQLLRVKALQESGHTLDEIRQSLDAPPRLSAIREPVDDAAVAPVAREIWRRLTLAPGVELHLAADVRVPSPAKLSELAAWCRTNLAGRDPSIRPGKHGSMPSEGSMPVEKEEE
jgi:DNA-binding transcriptional MerR regulator